MKNVLMNEYTVWALAFIATAVMAIWLTKLSRKVKLIVSAVVDAIVLIAYIAICAVSATCWPSILWVLVPVAMVIISFVLFLNYDKIMVEEQPSPMERAERAASGAEASAKNAYNAYESAKASALGAEEAASKACEENERARRVADEAVRAAKETGRLEIAAKTAAANAVCYAKTAKRRVCRTDEAPTATETSVEETPVTEAPAEEPTTTEAPAEEPTTTEAPAEEPTTTEAPAEEPTATETPAEEPTATETPAEEKKDPRPVVYVDVEDKEKGITLTYKVLVGDTINESEAFLVVQCANGSQSLLKTQKSAYKAVKITALEMYSDHPERYKPD